VSRLSFAALLITPALGLAVPASAATILPGYWESTTHSDLLVAQQSTDRKCITPAQVDSYLTGPANRHYSCTYDRRAVGGGTVQLAGQCVDKSGLKIDVSIAGTYTPQAFHLKADLRTVFAGLPIVGDASIDAHRISDDCPAPTADPKASGPR